MAPSFMLVPLFVISASSLKYTYVPHNLCWDAAQEYCRKNYTDLAPVSSERDMRLLQKAIMESSKVAATMWIGLWRTADKSKWMWSGGAEVTTCFWDTEQGQPGPSEMFGLLINNKWHDADSNFGGGTHFLCYKVHAVRERKTWEEALEFCREHHQDLASVASDTEMMLMQKELNKQGNATAHVWVALRFLAGEWLWVDGQPLKYEAWGEQTQCPAVGCGALRVTGTHEYNQSEIMAQADVVTEWNARNCSERLHFLCY